jgi:hypothetical protein
MVLAGITEIRLEQISRRTHMADSRTLNTMIANFMVLEQLVINLTQIVSEGFEDPREIRSALMKDLHERFSLLDVPDSDAARHELYKLANEQLHRLEPRLLGDLGEVEKE